MTPRRRRMALVATVVAGMAAAAGLALMAFQENLLYYYTPTQLLAGDAPTSGALRLGGMVAEESVQREQGTLRIRFAVTDYNETVPVSYEGVLPDLFREGQGVVVDGRLDPDGRFQAERVLAKHDENYMPPDVAAQGHEPGDGADYGGGS